MATVFFEHDDLEISVPDGTRLQDAIAESGADIPFGCREGECATCIIEVLEGMDHLSDHSENEEFTLMEDEREAGIRLSCQVVVQGGYVRVRPAEDMF